MYKILPTLLSISLFTQVMAVVGGAAITDTQVDDTIKQTVSWAHPSYAVKPSANAPSPAQILGLHIVTQHSAPITRPLACSAEINEPGLSSKFDAATFYTLKQSSELYQRGIHDGETFKVAEFGCGDGTLGSLLQYVAGPEKGLELILVDGVQENVQSAIKTVVDVRKKVKPASTVKARFMQSLLEDLGTHEEFSEAMYGTLHMIICLNVFHLTSPQDMFNTLTLFRKLLCRGGVLIFSHMNMNLRIPYHGPKPDMPGLYAYPTFISPNEILRFESCGSLTFSPQDLFELKDSRLVRSSKTGAQRKAECEKGGLVAIAHYRRVAFRVTPESLRDICLRFFGQSLRVIMPYVFDRIQGTPLLIGQPRFANNCFLVDLVNMPEMEEVL